jgi:hypothetical protein
MHLSFHIPERPCYQVLDVLTYDFICSPQFAATSLAERTTIRLGVCLLTRLSTQICVLSVVEKSILPGVFKLFHPRSRVLLHHLRCCRDIYPKRFDNCFVVQAPDDLGRLLEPLADLKDCFRRAAVEWSTINIRSACNGLDENICTPLVLLRSEYTVLVRKYLAWAQVFPEYPDNPQGDCST